MWFLLAPLMLLSSVALASPPLKVFILAGQSNMIGLGSLDHLDNLVSIKCSEYRQTLWDEASKNYIDIDRVYVKYGSSKQGKLKVGRSGGFTEYDDRFGPDVSFGWTISQAMLQYDESNILLIKTAWGGKNLAVDFRPPSAGTGNYEYVNGKPIEHGHYYRLMINEILSTLNGLEGQHMIPYSKEDGYELAGFVWLHGWNDMLYWETVKSYDRLLAKFIRDVRLDLSAPDLPFIIGELGMHGFDLSEHAEGRVLAFRAKQEAVTRRSEFRDNTIFVRTAELALPSGTDTLSGEGGAVYDRIEHYYGRADTFFHIGRALGEGALRMMNIETDIANVLVKKDGCESEELRSPEESTRDSIMREEGQPEEKERNWIADEWPGYDIDKHGDINENNMSEEGRPSEERGGPVDTTTGDPILKEEGRSEEKERDSIAKEWSGYDIDVHIVEGRDGTTPEEEEEEEEKQKDDGFFESEGQPSSSEGGDSDEKENIFHRSPPSRGGGGGNKFFREKTRRSGKRERSKPNLRRSRPDDEDSDATNVITGKVFRFD